MSETVARTSWWRRVLRRRRPGAVDREAELSPLLGIAQRAVAAQPEADWVIRQCAAAGDVPGTVASAGGRLTTRYLKLRNELAEVPFADPALAGARAELARLLHYHQWLVREAVHLAFATASNPYRDQARQRMTGLGPPGARLRELAEELVAQQPKE
jgi:hypothetical protein